MSRGIEWSQALVCAYVEMCMDWDADVIPEHSERSVSHLSGMRGLERPKNLLTNSRALALTTQN